MRRKLIKYREKTFMLSITLVLYSIPLNFGYISAATIIFIVANAISIKNFKKPSIKKAHLLFIIFYLWGIISIFWSIDIASSVDSTVKLLPLCLVPLILIYAPPIQWAQFYKVWKWVSWYFVILFFYFVSLALYRYQLNADIHEFMYHTLVSPLNLNAIYVSYVVSICILVTYSQRPMARLDRLLMLVLVLFLLLLSSKLILVLTVLGVIIQSLYHHEYKFKKLTAGLWIIAFTSLLIIFSPLRNRFTTELESNYEEVWNQEVFNPIYEWKGGTIRLLLMRVGVESLNTEQRWIQGVGVGASQNLIKENLKSKRLYKDYWAYNFHNQYFQILVELGLVGLIVYLAIFIYMLYNFRTNVLFLCIILSVFFWGITESFLCRQRGLIFFMMMVAMLLNTPLKMNIAKNDK